MALEYSGNFNVNVPAESAFKYLTDIKWISGCLPSLTDLNIINENEFTATFIVDVSSAAKKLHIEYLSQMTAKMKFKFLEKKIERVLLEGSGRAAGSKLDIKLEFAIKGISDNNAEISWKVQIEPGILLKFFGHNLINDTVNSIASEVIKCISNKFQSVSS